ncbi:hypothetical protein PVK06_022864 [Gossypium arboreum]|uniref:Uncharacterized protein n=1 Tax=Gossypium arboreum TaxID=29729 RepID=A0ABR0P9I1_GOSAR|nr:hypothetical protein PVK06_022864 [Gossypium arboreum]
MSELVILKCLIVWMRLMESNAMKLYSMFQEISTSYYEATATSSMCSSDHIVLLADTVNSKSSSVSSWKHAFKWSPIASQALPVRMDFKYVRSVKSLDLNLGLPSFSTIAIAAEDVSIHGENTPLTLNELLSSKSKMHIHSSERKDITYSTGICLQII